MTDEQRIATLKWLEKNVPKPKRDPRPRWRLDKLPSFTKEEVEEACKGSSLEQFIVDQVCKREREAVDKAVLESIRPSGLDNWEPPTIKTNWGKMVIGGITWDSK